MCSLGLRHHRYRRWIFTNPTVGVTEQVTSPLFPLFQRLFFRFSSGFRGRQLFALDERVLLSMGQLLSDTWQTVVRNQEWEIFYPICDFYDNGFFEEHNKYWWFGVLGG
jgi:hypothetical protein